MIIKGKSKGFIFKRYPIGTVKRVKRLTSKGFVIKFKEKKCSCFVSYLCPGAWENYHLDDREIREEKLRRLLDENR